MASGHCSILLIAALFLFATTGDSTVSTPLLLSIYFILSSLET